MDRLKEIDWTKNISYMVIYFIVVFSFFMIFTLPALQATKEKNISYRKAVISSEGTKKQLAKIEESIDTFESSNKKILNSLTTPYDKEIIEEGLEANIEDVVIKNITESKADRYDVVSMSIEGVINSPKDFYNTIDTLNSSKYIAKATFPISLDRYGDKIKISFMLKVYKAPN